MITIASTIALILVSTAALLCVLALARPRSLPDRIVALDLFLSTIVSGIAIGAARTGIGTYLDALVVASLLGFIGTITVARFIERRGA